MDPVESKILNILEQKGPLIGQEIVTETGCDELLVWRTCRSSKNIAVRMVGTRYLRLDRRIEGFARLSPSILREFLTYTVIGLPQDALHLEQKTHEIMTHIRAVSREKSELAYSTVSSLSNRFENENALSERVCFILAGDIVYNMAHDVSRPERSTGKLVKGSDMDLVVVAEDTFSEKSLERLDEAIFKEKYQLMMAPHLREEIDYVVKPLKRVGRQIKFDSYRHMVACKILREGTLLYGSEETFYKVKTMLREHGVIEKLDRMEARAKAFRRSAEKVLLHEDPKTIKESNLHLFYPAEESEEFE